MKGLLAATLVFMAGCGFDSPESSSAQPDAGTTDPPTGDAPAATRCSTYDYAYNGHRYRLVQSGLSWTDANNNCAADGGYLLKLESSGEDSQVAIVVSEPTEVWIGLSDGNNDGSYVWTDDSPPIFTHWSSAPSASSPDCVVKNTLLNDGRWYTRDCTSGIGLICECNP